MLYKSCCILRFLILKINFSVICNTEIETSLLLKKNVVKKYICKNDFFDFSYLAEIIKNINLHRIIYKLYATLKQILIIYSFYIK